MDGGIKWGVSQEQVTSKRVLGNTHLKYKRDVRTRVKRTYRQTTNPTSSLVIFNIDQGEKLNSLFLSTCEPAITTN